MYTAEDTLRYVTRSSTEEDKFLKWLRRQRREETVLKRTYSLKEVAYFLNVDIDRLTHVVKRMGKKRLTRNSGYRFTSNQIADVRRNI